MAKNEYSEKDYEKDSEIFEPESISDGRKPLSEKAFEAQKRLNAHPEMGKKYYKKHPERLNDAENAYKSRHKEYR